MPVERPKSIFEPAMTTSVDHLKKDDLQFDIEAEIARFREKKQEPSGPKTPATPPRPQRELP